MIQKEGHTPQLIMRLCFVSGLACCYDSSVSPHNQLCLLQQISRAAESGLFSVLCSDFVVSDLKAVWSIPTAASPRHRSMNVMGTALVESCPSDGCKTDVRI